MGNTTIDSIMFSGSAWVLCALLHKVAKNQDDLPAHKAAMQKPDYSTLNHL